MLERLIADLTRALDSGKRSTITAAAKAITTYLFVQDTSTLDQRTVQKATRLVQYANQVLDAPARVVAPRVVASRVVPELPKIIHCTWAGGGAIAKTKTLAGIQTWLAKTDYAVWIWWDDAHQYNMNVRRILRSLPSARVSYDLSAADDDLKVRRTVAPGRDLHNLRFLSQGMTPEDKLALARALIDESFDDMAPLRALATQHPDRVKLCNIRSHEHLTGMSWVNRDYYSQELTRRGMFAAAASDILRYEVVYNFGGVYMDVDIEVLNGLGTLRVAPEGALSAITADRKGAVMVGTWVGRDQIATTAAYHGKCLYVSNCIVAAQPRSPMIEAMRQTIALSYQLIGWRAVKASFELDPKRELEAYWKANITRSTLDLTGPNLVRDVLWLRQSGAEWRDIPTLCVQRLVTALKEQPDLRNSVKELGTAHHRTDYVWRDDLPAHQAFWQWVAAHAAFPMRNINCDTAAADRSDCRAASLQKPDADEVKVGVFLVHFPEVKVGEELKGVLANLHKQHNVETPLPTTLTAGDRLLWGYVRWQVKEIDNVSVHAKRRRITLERL